MSASMPGARVAFDYSGCHVLVTGGTSGIGHALASAFADAGAAVAVTGTRPAATDYDDVDLARFAYHSLALTDRDGIERVAAAQGTLDVLVNNAGANLPGLRSEYEPDVFEETVAINLTGAFRLTSALEDRLVASRLAGGGNVLNVASLAAFAAVPLVPAYGAAKAGLVQLTRTLATAWASEGVRVNAIAPGFIRTRMTEPMAAIAELSQPVVARTPMGRWGTPADVVGPALFLASPAAAFVTGQVLVVDGGYSVVC